MAIINFTSQVSLVQLTVMSMGQLEEYFASISVNVGLAENIAKFLISAIEQLEIQETCL